MMTDPEISLDEAYLIAEQLHATLNPPARATNESVGAEWAAIDAALSERGIVNRRPDIYGRSPEGGMTWWIGQREDGHITGKSAALQADAAVVLSLHPTPGRLLWLVPDPTGEIHRRYFPRPTTPSTVWHFEPTSGPSEQPTPVGSLFGALGDWEGDDTTTNREVGS